MFIYVYVAGHGCADVRQYLLLNTHEPEKAMYNIEEQLRKKSRVGNGYCFIFAIYDVCRLQSDADKIKALLKKNKAVPIQKKSIPTQAQASEIKELPATTRVGDESTVIEATDRNSNRKRG